MVRPFADAILTANGGGDLGVSLFAAGLAVGLLGLSTGGACACATACSSSPAERVRWFVAHLPSGPTTLAITLGHVILGQTEAALDVSHDHEMVHVRQYAALGPLLGPAYLLCSLVLWTRGAAPTATIRLSGSVRRDRAGDE